MKRDGEYFVLASGRRFYANGGILGMSEHLRVAEGYDGMVESEGVGPFDDDCDHDAYVDCERCQFTQNERREIAAHMVGLWRRWAGHKR